MADAEDSRDEEQWLYGDNAETLPTCEIKKEAEPEAKNDVPPPGEGAPPEETNNGFIEGLQNEGTEPGEVKDDEPAPIQDNGVAEKPKEAGEEGAEEEEEDEDDDSEDDVHVTIGDIKTSPQYSNLNIKRGAQLSSGLEKLNKQAGKFSIEEFESIGTINGVPAHEFSIDALEDKPWRKPGADITDYFNYGFNEETWRAYCERQKQMRIHESGVGLGGLGVSRANPSLTVVNENAKYSTTGSNLIVGASVPGAPGQRKAGPPPPVRRPGVIDVIGSVTSRRSDSSPPKESPIQVMGGDNRRDYNRKGFDMTVPPPGFVDTPPPMAMVPSYPPHGGYNQDYYNPEMDPYYQSYEPSQDMQWGNQMMNQVWSSRHRDKKSHSSHSLDSKRSKNLHANPMNKDMDVGGPMIIKQEPIEKSSKDRERDREQRHKERHRHRSRSRSGERSERRRKHKSRSRSPGHRSHKKKKSKKSDRSKEGSD